MVEPAQPESTGLGVALAPSEQPAPPVIEEGEQEPATLNDLLDEDAKGEHLSEFSDFSSDRASRARKTSQGNDDGFIMRNGCCRECMKAFSKNGKSCLC